MYLASVWTISCNEIKQHFVNTGIDRPLHNGHLSYRGQNKSECVETICQDEESGCCAAVQIACRKVAVGGGLTVTRTTDYTTSAAHILYSVYF